MNDETNTDFSMIQLFDMSFLFEYFKNRVTLRIFSEFAGVCTIFFQILYFDYKYDFSKLVLLSPFFLYFVYQIVRCSVLIYHSENEHERMDYINGIINYSMLALYVTFIGIKLLNPGMLCIITFIPIAATLIPKVVFVHAFWQELTSISELFYNISRFSGIMQSLMISVKYDGYCKMSWKVVFWPYYMFLIIFFVYSIILFCILIFYVFQLLKGRVETILVIFIFWLNVSLFGLCVGSLSLVINLTKFLDGNDDAISQGLLVMLFFLPIIGLFSLFLYCQLKRSVVERTTINADPSSRNFNDLTQDNNLASILSHPSLITVTSLPLSAPKYLYKFSSTFFQRINSKLFTQFDRDKEIAQRLDMAPLEDEKPEIKVEREKNETETERASPPIISKADSVAINSIKQIIEVSECSLCTKAQPDGVLMECGHGGICFRCAMKILFETAICPQCRHQVLMVLRINPNQQFGKYVPVLGGMTKNLLQDFASNYLPKNL